jgi:hypothetical protein
VADAAVADDEGESGRGDERVDGNVGGTSLHRAVDRDQGLEALVHVKADAIARAYALVEQDAGEPARPLLELLIGQSFARTANRIPAGRPGGRFA